MTLPNELRPSRFLTSEHSLTVLYNPHTYTFSVHVTPINDQPVTGTPRFNFPAIAYDITTTPISGKLVKDFLTEAKATDIDGDELGIAIVQALNTSIGSWYYKSPWGIWTQIIIDNPSYSDSLRGNISVMVLNSSYYLKFQMHNNDTLWSNVEASAKAKIVCLSWDGSDDRTIGWRNIKRPSEAISAYSKRSVTAIVQRKGCDGRAGSKGRIDRCGICGGDDTSCMGCDGVLNSGAVIGKLLAVIHLFVIYGVASLNIKLHFDMSKEKKSILAVRKNIAKLGKLRSLVTNEKYILAKFAKFV